MRKLFGTDGIRGVAGEFPLDADTSFIIGRALGHHLGRANGPPKVILGQDTRESSAWIADSVAAGLAAASVKVESAGVITTPGIAYLAHARGFAAGVVISASHNPWTDNGIKVFASSGYKLPDAVELEIEQEIFSLLADAKAASSVVRSAPRERSLPGSSSLRRLYVRWLAEHVKGTDLSHLRVVVDCAHGAASKLAKEVLSACGVRSRYLHHTPDGRNINDRCGALFPQVVAEEVKHNEADLGVTFDGDADRALFADAAGNIVNGDAVLLLAARDMKARSELSGDQVVATTMSNMGLEAALSRSGIRMLRAPVGDKYVLEEMQKSGVALGGEQSGHIIFARQHTTGDGLLTALRVMETIVRSGKALAELIGDLEVFPQVIKNVRVRMKKPLNQIPEVARAIAEAERALDGNGRIVVRYSGTEPLARVMVEAQSEQEMHRAAEAICEAIEHSLGV